VERQHAGGAEPWIDLLQTDEAADGEPGGDEQDQREGDLGHDQHRPRTLLPTA
jgi:hypothetical protein